ncbi:MAG: endolytic transglycosylase MltG [Spirochaetota bacterium]|nr:MAG: endolytic transglycosylase MltG [Spirochaetota bacterium]
MKKIKILIIPVAVIILVGCFFLLFSYYNSPVKEIEPGSLFSIKKGESVYAIAHGLEESGIIRSEKFFIFLVRTSRNAKVVKSGVYGIDLGMKNTDILRMITRGIVATEKFTIPEGLHIKQIADLLERKKIVGADEFIEASSNQRILEKYNIPFDSAEGFIFPDTYIIAQDLSAEQIVEVTIERFFSSLSDIPYRDFSDDELSKVVIIASLVEKEAKLDEERPLIAAVFYNRLQNGKRLEACSTVQYILGKTKDRLLYSDLKIKSPYNTYLHTGLPPGPISNPGIKSLRAAVYPAEVDYLFFVSKRDGSHHFSTTYSEHLKAIEKYSDSKSVGHQIS